MSKILVILTSVTLSMGLYGWIVSLRKMIQGRPVLEYEPRRPVPWGMAHIFLFIIIMLTLQWSLAYALGVDMDAAELSEKIRSREYMLVASGVARLLAVAGISAVVMVGLGGRLKDLGIQLSKIPHDIALGLGLIAMVGPLAIAMQVILTNWFPAQHPVTEWLSDSPTFYMLCLAGFSAVIVAPVAEEFLFRMLLQGWLEKLALGGAQGADLLLGEVVNNDQLVDEAAGGESLVEKEAAEKPPADRSSLPVFAQLYPIFTSSLVFALMHYGQGPAPIPLFFLSLGLGFVYQRTHRILPCIVAHMFLNAFSVLTFWSDIAGEQG